MANIVGGDEDTGLRKKTSVRLMVEQNQLRFIKKMMTYIYMHVNSKGVHLLSILCPC